MPRKSVPLISGAYQTRAIVRSSQACINLYPEVREDQQATSPVAHFPTPGLTTEATPPIVAPSRCLYRATNGTLWQVVGPNVYYISQLGAYTLMGIIPDRTTPVSMTDNGLAILMVDGSSVGYAIDLTAAPGPAAFAAVNDPAFAGGTRADYVDTFFVSNIPGTDMWQTSLSSVSFGNLTAGVINPGNIYAAYDPLDFGVKAGSADPIVSIVVMNKNVWLIGSLTTEIWYNAGSADFSFAVVPGAFVEHGCIAPYSVCAADLSVFWLSQDRQGKAITLRGTSDYKVTALSTRGIEDIFQSYSTISDAIGGTFQLKGHAFYVITFPAANATFAAELRTQQWHQLAWVDMNGNLNRHRAQNWAFCYSLNLCGDWQYGTVYQLDPSNFTDAGNPIIRVRTIPHFMNDGAQIRLNMVIADVQGGTLTSDTDSDLLQVFLGVSINRGASYGNLIASQFGAAGEYANMPIWRNLGMSRDFVLKLQWDTPIDTVLNGIFIDFDPAGQ